MKSTAKASVGDAGGGPGDSAAARSIRIRTGRYLNGAIDQRNAIYFNEIDHLFANKDHGEIRYVFDSNIVRFFLNPFRYEEYRKVAPFERTHSPETMRALGAVTAEFIMSRELPGQWGAPPLISAAHAHEVANRARDIGEQAREALSPDQEDQVDGMIADLIRSVKTSSRLRNTIDWEFDPLSGLGDLLEHEAIEALEFRRLTTEGLIRPLHLEAFGKAQILKIDRNDDAFLAIRDAIEAFRDEKQLQNRSGRQGLINDAETLLQVARLNALAAERHHSGSVPRQVRYLLVTADQALFNAAIEWWGTKGEVVPEFFPVRRLGQYIPFHHLADEEMAAGAASDNRELIGAIRKSMEAAIDAFLSTVGGAHGEPPQRLPVWVYPERNFTQETSRATSPLFESMSELQDQLYRRAIKDESYGRSFEDLNDRWALLAKETVFYEAHRLGRRIDAFNSLSAFLRDSNDIRSAVLQIIHETLSNVELGHVTFSVQHHVAAMMEEFSARPGGEPAPRRGLAVPSTRFEKLIDAPLFTFLTDLVSHPQKERLDRLLDRMRMCPAHHALFFSATVAFWASKWENAEFFIERALETLPREGRIAAEVADLEYFAAVAKRYGVMDMDTDPADRVRRLKALIGPVERLERRVAQTSNKFLICRITLEHAMLQTLIAYGHFTVPGEPEAHDAEHAFREALSASIRVLEMGGELETTLPEDLFRLLQVEAVIAFAGCVFFRAIYVDNPDLSDLGNIGQATGLVERVLVKAGDMLPEIYRLAPELMDVIFCSAPEQKRARVDGFVAKLETFTERSGSTTRMDNELTADFRKRLSMWVRRSR